MYLVANLLPSLAFVTELRDGTQGAWVTHPHGIDLLATTVPETVCTYPVLPLSIVPLPQVPSIYEPDEHEVLHRAFDPARGVYYERLERRADREL